MTYDALVDSARTEGPGLQTPADLLAELQQELEGSYRYPDPHEEGLRRLRHRVEVPDDEFEEIVEDLKRDPGLWVRDGLEELATPLQPDFRDFLLDEDRVLAAELNTGDANACTLKASNGGWLIVVNRGLMGLVYGVARALCTHIRYDGQDLERLTGNERSGELIAGTLDWYVITGVPLGVDFEIDALQLQTASRITSAAEKFVIAHEVAHQLEGHVEAETRAMSLGGVEVEVLDTDRSEEHVADVVGASLVMNGSRYGDDLDPWIAYAGIELFFRTIDLLEAYLGYPDSDTHPPAAERLDVVRGALEANTTQEEFEFVTNLADCFADVLGSERDHVLKSERREEALARQPEFDRFLENLLDRYAERDRDRYVPFYEEFCARQMDFHPEVICRGLASWLDAGARANEGSSQPDSRWMLLLGFLGLHSLFRYAVADWVDPELGEALREEDRPEPDHSDERGSSTRQNAERAIPPLQIT